MLGRLKNLFPSETLHGYEHPELIETIFQKTVAYQPTEPWPELGNAETVLDFGGACGIHYKRANHQTVKWAVVETPAMVERAKTLETYHLRFFTDIDDAASWLGNVDVMHSNGAIQYTNDPLATARKLVSVGSKRLLWYRLFFGEGGETQISSLQDNGPGRIAVARKKVAYDFMRISRADFVVAHNGYRVEAYGEDWFRFTR
jgi:putative methyltransferase (TIGR04325 family)